jgi:hypothetical protein
LVARFIRRADDAEPAVAVRGNAVDQGALRAAGAAVQTAGDIIVRAAGNTSGRGVGLRGGVFEISDRGGSRKITLEGVRWTEDLAVSGTIDVAREASRAVHARLAIEGPAGLRGRLDVEWPDRAPDAQASIAGSISGRQVRARMPAP